MAANEPGQPPSAVVGDISRNVPTPASALAVGAHPDDVEFGAGATLAKWAAAGCVIHHLVCTDGSKGTWNPDADTTALIAVRRDEQREAARRLSGAGDGSDRVDGGAGGPVAVGSVTFLGKVDGELDASLVTVGEVARVIRTVRPEVVLGHDPWKRYRLHPDHRNAGVLVCDAIVAARDPHFFKDHGLPAHRPQALLLWEADQPDHVEDVTEFVAVKLHALEAHASQFESTMHAADEADLETFRARIRARLAELGAPHDLRAAEVFKLITDL
jgi:LmbE family N-acetylglucosaminyl deacetylase